MRCAFALRADLHDAFVLSRGGEHRFAFQHIDADGLLAINIRARFHRGDGVERVPMVRRNNDDEVKLVLLQHRAIIVVSARLVFRGLPLAGDFHRAREHVFVGVADGYDFDRRNLIQAPEIAFAIPTRADESDATRLIRGCERGGDVAGRGQGGEGRGTEL